MRTIKTLILFIAVSISFSNCSEDDPSPLYRLPSAIYSWLNFHNGTFWIYEDAISGERYYVNGKSLIEFKGTSGYSLKKSDGELCVPYNNDLPGYICSFQWEQITLEMWRGDDLANVVFATMGSYAGMNQKGDEGVLVKERDSLAKWWNGEYREAVLFHFLNNGDFPSNYESQNFADGKLFSQYYHEGYSINGNHYSNVVEVHRITTNYVTDSTLEQEIYYAKNIGLLQRKVLNNNIVTANYILVDWGIK